MRHAVYEDAQVVIVVSIRHLGLQVLPRQAKRALAEIQEEILQEEVRERECCMCPFVSTIV